MIRTNRAKAVSNRSKPGRDNSTGQSLQLLELIKCVAVAANEAETLEQAFKHCIDQICRSLGWNYGHVFIKDLNNSFKLGPVADCPDSASTSAFYEQTRSLSLVTGTNLPADVVASGKPVFITEFDSSSRYVRAEAARKAGIRTGMAFPVPAGAEIAAVLEFFSTEAVEPEPELLEAMSIIGVQLGRVIERERANQALLRSEQRFCAMTHSMLECVVSSDRNGNIVSINKGAERILGYSASEVVGKPFLVLIPPNLHGLYLQDLQRFQSTGQSEMIGKAHESEALCKNGRVLPVEVSISTWNFEGGEYFTAVLRDISERLKTREESERFFNLSQDLLAIVGLDGRLRRANPIHQAVLGYSIEELLQINYLELIHPDDFAGGKKELEKIARGESINFECRIRCKDGSYKLLSVRATPLPDSGLFFCASRDVTARRATEEKLRESEDRFRHLVDNASEIIYQTDAQGQIEIYNPTARKVFGYTKQELYGKHYLDFVSPRYKKRAAVFYFKQYRDKVHSTYWEVPVVTKDGQELWLAQSVQLMLEKGSVTGFQVVAREITQRKHMEHALIEARRELERRVESRTAELAQANAALRAEIVERKQVEDALRQSQQRLALHVQQTPLGVIAWDANFRVVEWNRAAERIFGFTYQEAFGTHAELIIPDAVKAHVDAIWRALISGGGGQRSTNENITKDGRTIICDWYNTPLINASGQVIGVASLVSDITDRVRAEEGLRKAHSELEDRVLERTAEISKLNESLRNRAADLEAVNKELEAFSYSVSHDLRAPLRAIDGFARIILEDYSASLDESGRRYLDIICKSTARMGQLIDDLLAFSRLGRQPMAMTPIDMQGLVESVLEDFKDLSPQRNIEFVCHSLPPANGDRSMVRQVLMNLLSNAVKFSKFKEKAVIEIGATKDNSRTVYYIKDNGAGFDMQYVNKIFGVFQRLHAVDEFEGTGVGLAIVQRVISRHGGKVWAQGETGKGATFYFTLEKDHEHASSR